jgi:hypothetical protein
VYPDRYANEPDRPHIGVETCFWEAVLGLRGFRDRATLEALARDHGISRATPYRYVDEVITALAGQAPDLWPGHRN